MPDQPFRLYNELSDWYLLLTPPEEYAEEAEIYRRLILEAATGEIRTVLELGAGSGNNATHLKSSFTMTLTDLSPNMLRLSEAQNPECEHHLGDMRTIRLGRQFDAVFIHDAIDYITTEDDLRQTFETAFVHVRPGGVLLIAPDCVRDTFESHTDHGGSDGEGRSMRYLEWTTDPDPNDTTYLTDFIVALREEGKPLIVEHDQHLCGVFPRATWLRLLSEAGFIPEDILEDRDLGATDLFRAIRPT